MNYYDVFGLPPTASNEDISAAHKALAKMYHPDINNSKDAHEKMTILNEANEVLSDTEKRKEYNIKLGLHKRHESQAKSRVIKNRDINYSQSENQRPAPDPRNTEERAEKAEILRKKAEERLRKDEAAQIRRVERAKKRDYESSLKSKQMRADINKQHVLNVLSNIVMDGNAQKNASLDDVERRNAAEVLLSLVRKDNVHLHRMAEEADRKQRIEDILSLVKEYNEEANPDRLI